MRVFQKKAVSYLLIGIFIFLSLLIQLFALPTGFMSGQDPTKMFQANNSFKEIVFAPHGDIDIQHTRLHLLVMKIFLLLFGHSEMTMRLSGIFFSPFALFAIYLFFKKSVLKEQGALQIVLLTFFSVVYLVKSIIPDCKTFFMIFLFMGLFFLFKTTAEKKRITLNSVLWLLCAVGMFHAYNYSFIFFPVSLILYYYYAKRDLKRIALYAGVVFLFSLPEVIDFSRYIIRGMFFNHFQPTCFEGDSLILMLQSWGNNYLSSSFIITVLFAIIFVFSLWQKKKESTLYDRFSFWMLVVPFAATVFAALTYQSKYFYVYVTLPFFYYLALRGFQKITIRVSYKRIIFVSVIIIFIIINSAYYIQSLREMQKITTAFQYLSQSIPKNAMVLIPRSFREPFLYYNYYPDLKNIVYGEQQALSKNQYYKNLYSLQEGIKDTVWENSKIAQIKQIVKAETRPVYFIKFGLQLSAPHLYDWVENNFMKIYCSNTYQLASYRIK